MMMSSLDVHEPWIPVSETDREEVQNELERILGSVPFRNSRRYPALLRYVVEKALNGEVDDLKERILGVEVFGRPAAYDTNADPVVRFSAGEVRRRIAQYYQEKPSENTLEISLPIGSYVPHFHRIQRRPEKSIFPEEEHGPPFKGDSTVEYHPAVEGRPPTVLADEAHQASSLRHQSFQFLLLGILIGGGIVAVATFALSTLQSRLQAEAPIMEVWKPLLTNPNMVLISAGRTQPELTEPPESPNATIAEHLVRPEARISFPAVQAISEVSGFLRTQHKRFRLHEAYSSNLQDMHGLPVVLVGAYNNLWTLRLLEPLRFHFVRTDKLRYIEDAHNPQSRDWSVDFNKPYLQQTADYAIVGRFYDATTSGPVVVIAGVGSNGSSAAAEFMVSPEGLKQLASFSPSGSLDGNFEAVLKVEVVEGGTGAVSVVSTQFW